MTLTVVAPEEGPFKFGVFATADPTDRIEASERLRALVARRFESAEANQGRPWSKFALVVTRAELPEWQGEVRYEF